jgi:hypothetical protein
MTAREMASVVGRRGVWRVQGLGVFVWVTDARKVFGRVDYEIRPDSGTGDRVWVEGAKVQLAEVA